MNYNLKDKIAVITGAGGAICGEIAKAFAAEDVSVAIWDISIGVARKKRDEILSAGDRAIAIECDATEKASVASATKTQSFRQDSPIAARLGSAQRRNLSIEILARPEPYPVVGPKLLERGLGKPPGASLWRTDDFSAWQGHLEELILRCPSDHASHVDRRPRTTRVSEAERAKRNAIALT